VNEIKIDPEFKTLIPPLTDEEYQQLTENIVKEGCRDALIVWDGIIIDGHNRYEICKYYNIAFKTEEKFFDNRDEVKEWIIRNQFGRRNLSVKDRVDLAFKLEEVIKIKAKANISAGGGDKKSGLQPVGKAIEKVHTDDELAKIAQVSHETIRMARVVKEEGTVEQKARLANGDAKIKTLYKEIRPKKEDKPVEKAPDEQPIIKPKVKIDFTIPTYDSTKDEEAAPNSDDANELTEIVTQFLSRASKYHLFMNLRIKELPKKERKALKEQKDRIKDWVHNFEVTLKQIEEELKQ